MTARAASLLGIGLAAALAACGGPAAPPVPPRQAGPAALHVTADRLEGRTWLAGAAARAAAVGAGPLQVLGADLASEGDRVGAFVEIPADECVLAIARTSPTIADVDLFAYEDDGDPFASDETPDSDSAVLVCPPHPRRLYVAARVMSGSGVLAVGVQSVPRGAADAVAHAVGARGRPGEESGRLESWPGLEAKIREHRARLGSRWEDVRRTAMPLDPRAATRMSITIEAGRCFDVLVTPSDEVSSVEVVAEDPTGRIVARARERGRDRTLLLCSAEAAEVTIAVRPRASQGLGAVIVGRSAIGAEPELADAASIAHLTETRELPDARVAHERSIAGRGYGAAKTVATGKALVGTRASFPVELPQGCARIDVVAGKPLASVEAELWDDKGSLLGASRGGAGATLFACGPGGAARLDLAALARPGPFAIELRKERSSPPLLVSHPVAAGRLLGRMNAGAEPAAASAAESVQAVPLDAATRRTLPLSVPANGCVEVIAAADAGGAGVDLRLVDASTGESALSRARHVVADRLCAGPAAKTGSIEVRLAAGKSDVLVLTRTAARDR